MALGTITPVVGTSGPGGAGPVFFDRISFPGDGSYPTGGTAGFEASVRAVLGAGAKGRDIVDIISGDCGDNKCEYDRANDKLKVRVISTGAEVGNGVNLSGVTFNLTVITR